MKKLYKWMVLFLLILMVMGATGCGKVDQGFEGAFINTMGSNKGEIAVVGEGIQWYNPIKYDLIVNPTFYQEYAWTAGEDEGSKNDESITFQSKNSLAFTADIGISFAIKPGKSGEIYKRYHKTVDDMIDTNLRNSVRDAFNRKASERDEENIYGPGKTKFIADVQQDVAKYWENYLDVKKIYLLGKLEPPKQVKIAIDKKIEATQKALQRRNEVDEAEAQADKDIAKARGESESKKLNTDAAVYKITQEATAKANAIELVNKQLGKSPRYIDYIKANRWDGKLPVYMAGKAPMPFMNIK